MKEVNIIPDDVKSAESLKQLEQVWFYFIAVYSALMVSLQLIYMIVPHQNLLSDLHGLVTFFVCCFWFAFFLHTICFSSADQLQNWLNNVKLIVAQYYLLLHKDYASVHLLLLIRSHISFRKLSFLVNLSMKILCSTMAVKL